MFSRFFSAKPKQQDDSQNSKRQFVRRHTDRCVAMIDGQIYPVENWSLGGILISADSRTFGMGDNIETTLKFMLRQQPVDVSGKARIVRKGNGNAALEFIENVEEIRKSLQQVIDDIVSERFVESQQF